MLAKDAYQSALGASGGSPKVPAWLQKLMQNNYETNNNSWGKTLGGDSGWLGVGALAGQLGLGWWGHHVAKQQAEQQNKLNQANIQMGWLNNMRQWQQAQNQANRSAQESALAGASFLKGIGASKEAIRDHVGGYIDTYGLGDTRYAQENALSFLDKQRYLDNVTVGSDNYVRTLKSLQDIEESDRVKKKLTSV